MTIQKLEKRILENVRRSEKPQAPRQIAKKVAANPKEELAARDALGSLVDRGVLKVTIDWNLRASE
jgi:hypothetical protein